MERTILLQSAEQQMSKRGPIICHRERLGGLPDITTGRLYEFLGGTKEKAVLS
jgi:hypothetical protein